MRLIVCGTLIIRRGLKGWHAAGAASAVNELVLKRCAGVQRDQRQSQRNQQLVRVAHRVAGSFRNAWDQRQRQATGELRCR